MIDPAGKSNRQTLSKFISHATKNQVRLVALILVRPCEKGSIRTRDRTTRGIDKLIVV